MREKLNSDELDFLIRVSEGRRLRPADRHEDRFRQRLRKKGLVEVLMNPRRWSVTPAGHAHIVAALRAIQESRNADR